MEFQDDSLELVRKIGKGLFTDSGATFYQQNYRMISIPLFFTFSVDNSCIENISVAS